MIEESKKSEETETSKDSNWLRRNSSELVAISALFISLCALVVSIIEMRTMKVQQEAMVYPHLDFGATYNSEGFSFIARNTGTGLAMIRSIEIQKDGKLFTNWLSLVDYLMPEGHKIDYGILWSGQINGKVIPAGESVTVFGLNWSEESRILEKRMRDIRFRICYCSLLDDCFEITDQKRYPEETKSCIFNTEVNF